MEQTNSHQSFSVLRHALAIWAALVALLTAGYGLLYHGALQKLQAEDSASRALALREARLVVRNRLYVASSDLSFMAANPVLKRYLASGSAEDRELLEQFFADLMNTRRDQFDQLRYLDETGMELVRINNTPQGAEMVPRDQLQNKASRYYFTRVMGLGPGEHYVSPFDLNVENGQVEQPHKPTLRFGARALDAEGKPRGVLVVNYLGAPLLQRLRALCQEVELECWLVNQDGHWLMGPHPDDQWGFMFPGRQVHAFADAYKAAWQAMGHYPDKAMQEFDHGGVLLGITRFVPAQDLMKAGRTLHTEPGMHWYLIDHMPAGKIALARDRLLNSYIPSYTLFALAFAVLSLLGARLMQRRIQANEALAEREQEFQALLESAPDAMVVTDAHGQIVLANAQVEAMFGHGREALLGQAVEVLMPQRYRHRHIHYRADYVADPVPRTLGQGRNLFARRQDGTEFPVSIALSSYQGKEGLRVIAVIRDVTEAHERAQTLRQALSKVAASNRALLVSNQELESFAYAVSHDLRTPLRSVDGFSQILLKEYADKLDGQGRDFLQRMRAAAQRMGQLIDDMLVLSRISRGELNPVEFDLSAQAREAVDRLQQAFPDRQVETVIQPGLRAWGDPKLIRIALDNLLGNAWKFTAKTEHARIEFGCEAADDRLECHVGDNGAGFDMAYADKLFAPFQRLHSPSDFPGTGVGLATVARVIHKHGGELRAEGAVGRGATFHFTLPTQESPS